MKCPKCKKDNLENKRIKYTGEVRGIELTINCDGLLCKNCGFKTVAPHQMTIFRIALSDAYRHKSGLLTSDEIRQAREKLGMNQDDFAAYLGVGVASIKRWELGKIQDASSDQLMRLKSDPQYAENNSSEVRQRVSEARAQM